MELYEPFVSLAVALAVGLLLGLEREQSISDDERAAALFPGGVRTFPLVSLSGAIGMLLAQQLGVWIVLAGAVVLGAFLVVSYSAGVKAASAGGLTTEFAFVLTYLLGALAVSRGIIVPTSMKLVVVGSVAVAATVLLSSKQALHGMAQKVSKEDTYATLKFLVVAVVALPLLPNRTMGPLAVLNPFNVGLMIVLIAGIGFVGYVAIRVLGTGRGLAITGLIGGLVSSTAVTLSFSGRAKETPRLAPGCALAVVLASAIMYGRVLVEVAVVYAPLLRRLIIPMLAMLVAGGVVSFIFYRRAQAAAKEKANVKFDNPFELSSAVKFGALYAGVLLVAKAATVYMGVGGTYLAGVLAGTTDVDAITLSMAALARDGLDANVAATTIILGSASNTVVKGGMAVVLGGGVFGRQVALAFGMMLAAGLAGVAFLWLA